MLGALRGALSVSLEGQGGPEKRLVTEQESFPAQWPYVTSDARRNTIMCSRRAGKTHGALLRVRKMLTERPGCRVIYATLIRRNCKKLFWQPLKRELSEAGWSFEANNTDMILTLENGSWLQALSCQGSDDLKTIRGDKADLFLVDECQEPNDDVLTELVLRIATAMLMDTGGALDLLGTVPAADPCFFTDCIDSGRYRAFSWDCFANPHLDPEEIKRTCEESGIGPGHPIYEREILGKRVKDPNSLAYCYEKGKNDYDPVTVDFTRGKWSTSMGIDLGFSDQDAIVVTAWNREDPERRLYQRFRWCRNHLSVDSLYEVVASAYPVYRPVSIIADHGGHGAVKVLETLKERLKINLGLKPPDVMTSVEFVNAEFRTSRLRLPTHDTETDLVIAQARKRLEHRPQLCSDVVQLLTGHNGDLPRELGMVLKSVKNNKTEINKSGFHSDLSEALRYAVWAAKNYRSKEPKPEPTYEEQLAMRDRARGIKGDKW